MSMVKTLKQIGNSYGVIIDKPIAEVFATFDWTPLAAASIGRSQEAWVGPGGGGLKKTARLCRIPCISRQPRCSRSRASDCGRPAARRNIRLNCPISCIQPSPPTCSRSRIGASSAGIAPRLSSRNWRPVQSRRLRYSANGIGKQPLFEARPLGTGS